MKKIVPIYAACTTENGRFEGCWKGPYLRRNGKTCAERMYLFTILQKRRATVD